MTEWPAEFRRSERLASVGQVGGFRAPSTPRTSWLGQVLLGLPGDEVDRGEFGVRPFPVLWRAQVDMPSHDEAPDDHYRDFLDDLDDEGRPTADGLKVGGWPTTVHGEVTWDIAASDEVQFVVRIASDEKSGVVIGDGGVLHFGWSPTRGWLMEWQIL